MTEVARAQFAVGDMVRLSALGWARSPRLRRRRGKVVGYSRTGNALRVIWEGSRTPSVLHASYLERAEAGVHE